MTARLVLTALLIAGPLAAQQPADERPWYLPVAEWGKFASLGLAGGMFALAAATHQRAEERFESLVARCRADLARCELRPDGRYLDAGSERLFQETEELDADARRWIAAGQVAVALSAVLWIVDLTQGADDPDNIPYTPFEVTAGPRETRLAIRIAF